MDSKMLFSLTSPRLFSAVSRKPTASLSSPSPRTQWAQLSPGRSISLRKRFFLLPAKATTEQSGQGGGEDVDSNIMPYCSINKAEKKSIGEMEQEFLQALQSFYYDGKATMSNEEFDNLKEELMWEGSSVVMLSSDEQRFLEASMAYVSGNPILNDEEFDKLKLKLKIIRSLFQLICSSLDLAIPFPPSIIDSPTLIRILRQSADVEEVERRVYEYEQGNTDFSPEEDPHVVGDCVKHVLRQLPSSPVPASCCTALLEAYKIDHKEARVKSLRSAIVETFPEPNRRLLLRILKMMHTITSHSRENRMTSSAVAACMSPLLLRPLLAGECDLEGFDALEDNSAQLLAAANAANNAQAIVTSLLEDYGNMINDEGLQRCSTSTDSHIGESGPENSSDEEDIEVKRPDLHNVDIEDGQTDDDDDDVMLSRKRSESSGYAGSDLYDYKEYGVEDSDAESPKDIHCSIESTGEFPTRVKRQIEEPFKDIEIASVSPTENCYQSGREAMPSVNPSTPLTAPRYTASAEKPVNKTAGLSTVSSKRSSPWGRGSGQKTPAKGSFDGSGNDELLIQRLELMKDELRQRIAKEAKGNAVLQASLERRKQALHERRLALEQDVGRLQEQLQAERDLRSALEVGLSSSCGHFSSQAADSKTRAELEEIALAEADVARLKQKVAELHHQLSQQRHHHLSSLPDAQSHHQFLQNHNTQLKSFQQDFDSILAFVNQERNQRTDESSLRAEWRNGRANNRQVPGSPRLNEASLGIPMEEFSPVMEYARHEHNNHPPPAASAALMELTTRLDFFKERRSQLMQQIHNLDLSYGSSSSVHRSSSPPWN